jgi:TolB-like protein/tetratricopeptide (TPR) repeat protein
MDAAEVRFGPFLLDLSRKQLTRGGAPVRLGARSMDILCALAAGKGELVTKDQLMAQVWSGKIVEENAIQVHVSALRKALDEEQNGASYVVTVPGRGYRFVFPSPSPGSQLSSGRLDLPDKPSIAVLSFDNLSGDREQEYFAAGIAEDIIAALARARWFFVIARNSSFAFKDKTVEVKQIAQHLGVQYVLEGSVRKSGDRVRITAQLIDAPAGVQIWGERFDRELRDIFAVQDEITERVAGAIEPELLKSEGLRATARGTSSLTAWDLVRQGTWQFHQITQPTHFRARELFREAIRLDPRLPEAHMWLGRASESIVGYGWSNEPASDLKEAVQSCLRGIQLDEKDPYGHYALSMSYMFSGALEQAIPAVEKSVDLSPSFALGHLGLGMLRLYTGDAKGAIEPLERGLRLNPFDPQNFLWFRTLALAHYFAEDPAKALAAALKSSQVRPDWRPAFEVMALCRVALDQMEAAHRCANEAMQLVPPGSDVLEQLKIRNPGWAERIAAALVEVGVRE